MKTDGSMLDNLYWVGTDVRQMEAYILHVFSFKLADVFTFYGLSSEQKSPKAIWFRFHLKFLKIVPTQLVSTTLRITPGLFKPSMIISQVMHYAYFSWTNTTAQKGHACYSN